MSTELTEHVESGGCDYLQNLADHLLPRIFTKLSCSCSSIADIKFLCRCSKVSKQFNTSIPLVSSLSITNENVNKLHDICPIILKKFKHISSLHLEHRAAPIEIEDFTNGKVPHLMWTATCGPNNYCIVALSFTSIHTDSSQRQNLPVDPVQEAPLGEVYDHCWTGYYVALMFRLHHNLISLIQEHKLLDEVVVTDRKKLGSLTLDKEKLVKMRNTTSDYGRRKVRYQSCLLENLHLPSAGVLLKGACVRIMKIWDKFVNYNDNDDDILSALHQGDVEPLFREALMVIFEKHRDMVKTTFQC